MSSTSMVLCEECSCNLTQRYRVLLPEPLRPIRQTTWRSGTSRLIFLRTCNRPKNLSRLEILTMGVFAAILSISLGETFFKTTLQITEDQGHAPIENGRHDQGLQIMKLSAADLGGTPHQFMHEAGDGNESRILRHGDEFISNGGNRKTQGLRQHHPTHGLRGRHSQGDGSL